MVFGDTAVSKAKIAVFGDCVLQRVVLAARGMMMNHNQALAHSALVER